MAEVLRFHSVTACWKVKRTMAGWTRMDTALLRIMLEDVKNGRQCVEALSRLRDFSFTQLEYTAVDRR